MQDTPPGERTRLWGISPVVLCWQSDVCFLLLRYLPCSLQHVPAEVSSASLLLNTHSHVQTHTLYLFCVSLEKKGKKSSSSWRSKPAACWSKRRSRFIQSCLVWPWAWPKRFLGRKRRLIAGTWKKLRGSLMGFLATLPPSALEVKELPACSTRWKQNHQRLQVRMESWWLLLWLFVPPISSWQFLTITVGCLLLLLPVQRKLSTCSAGGLMFVRLQFQLPSGKKRSPGALQIGSAKTSRQRDAWLALSQERLDI